jgi:hypothetical protein
VRRQSDGEEFLRVERSSKMPVRRGKKILARDGGEAIAIATAGLEKVVFFAPVSDEADDGSLINRQESDGW